MESGLQLIAIKDTGRSVLQLQGSKFGWQQRKESLKETQPSHDLRFSHVSSEQRVQSCCAQTSDLYNRDLIKRCGFEPPNLWCDLLCRNRKWMLSILYYSLYYTALFYFLHSLKLWSYLTHFLDYFIVYFSIYPQNIHSTRRTILVVILPGWSLPFWLFER
jgi:hypothetical protein